jgi:hypothetical protein
VVSGVLTRPQERGFSPFTILPARLRGFGGAWARAKAPPLLTILAGERETNVSSGATRCRSNPVSSGSAESTQSNASASLRWRNSRRGGGARWFGNVGRQGARVGARRRGIPPRGPDPRKVAAAPSQSFALLRAGSGPRLTPTYLLQAKCIGLRDEFNSICTIWYHLPLQVRKMIIFVADTICMI